MINFLIGIGIAVIYFFSAKIGFQFDFINPGVTAIWPSTGVAIAAILILGYRFWPGVFVGAFLADLTTVGTVFTSLGIATGNTLSALAVAFLVNKFAGGKSVFDRPIWVVLYFMFVIFASSISAVFGIFSLSFSGFIGGSNIFWVWVTWLIGDIGGGLIIAPILILFSKGINFSFTLRRAVEFLSAFILLVLTSLFIFGKPIHPFFVEYNLEYPVAPLLIWVAIRFDQRAAALSVLIVALIANIGTLRGFGPFFTGDVNTSLVFLQSFLFVVALSMFILAAVIKERRRLMEDAKRFDLMFHKTSDGIILFDENRKITYVSPSIKTVMGYDPYEFINHSEIGFIHPADKEVVMSRLRSVISGDIVEEEFEVRARRRGGEWIWIHFSITNLLNDPDVRAVVCVIKDISEKKASEETLRNKNEELRMGLVMDEALLNSMGEGFIASDKDGRILKINRAALVSLGWSREDMIGERLDGIVRAEDAEGNVIPSEDRPMGIVLGKKISYITNKDFYYIRQDGTKFPVAVVATPLMIDGEIYGAVEVFRDITMEKEAEKNQKEFISIASHQLRTPISTIHWYIEVLLEEKLGKLNDKQKEYLDNIFRANERLAKLVSELLSVSRIESKKFQIKKEEVNITEIIETIIKDLSSIMLEKHIKFEKDVDPAVSHIIGDHNVLRLIIQNILSNALKYTPNDGRVSLKVTKSKDSINIIVSDTGYGIPKNQQSRVFTKFFRADNVKEREADGTGLGLYIIKSILDRIGGSITFESEEGVGTVFYISLPIDGSGE